MRVCSTATINLTMISVSWFPLVAEAKELSVARLINEKPSRLQARPTVTHVVADSQLTGQPALRKVQTLSTWSGDPKAAAVAGHEVHVASVEQAEAD